MLLPNTWVKATKSGGNNTGPNCVECLQFQPGDSAVQTALVTALGFTHGGPPVPAGTVAGDVLVRDSKLGTYSPVLLFTPDGWATFTAEVADGGHVVQDGDHFRIVGADGQTGPDGARLMLSFTADEWDAFVDGCRKGEFTLATV